MNPVLLPPMPRPVAAPAMTVGPDTLLATMPNRPWQAAALADERPKHCIVADPRLGKTLFGARWVRSLFVDRAVSFALVSAPVRVCPLWKATLEEVGVTTVSLSKLSAKRGGEVIEAYMREGRPVCFVVNSDKLSALRKHLLGVGAYVCDEVHEMASPSSDRGRAARAIAVKARFVRTLTGTAIPNHHGNAWSALVMAGAWDRSWGSFMDRYCLAPATRVLTADLRWVSIDTVAVGDDLLGFDEFAPVPGHRTAHKSTVEALTRFKTKCVRVVTDKGDVVCSENHMWLTQRGARLEWTAAKNLRTGKRTSRIARLSGGVWETDTSYEGGYLAGVYDGEGTVAGGPKANPRSRLSFAQNDGYVLEKVKALLTAKGFEYRVASDKKCRVVHLKTRTASLRFLGMFRPSRLLPQAWRVYDGARLTAKDDRRECASVLRVEPVGEQEVVGIQTSTRTLFAEGLFSHNCVRDRVFLSKVIGHVREPEFFALFGRATTIVRREDVFGPDTFTVVDRKVEMPPAARATYKRLAKEWVLEEDGLSIDATHTLSRLTRLQQLTAGYLPDLEAEDGLRVLHEAKIDALMADMTEIAEAGEKAVVFHRFVHEGELARRALRAAKIPTFEINGSLNEARSEEQRAAFTAHEGAAVIVVQIKSGGVGISLAEATHAMYLSRSYSFVEDKQSRDRVYKPGARRFVTYYNVPGTVDMSVARALASKRDIHDVIRSSDLSTFVNGEE